MLTFWDSTGAEYRDNMSRRNFLRVGALGVAGLTLADVLRLRASAGTTAAPPKAVIMILLGGGPSHIDMYDLKPNAPAEVRGEFKPIKTNVPGFDIAELMPQQAKIADKLALVRNLRMTTSSHNYMEITSGFLWGNQIPGGQGKFPRPALGSVVSRLRGGGKVPPFVSLWGTEPPEAEDPAFLGPAHRPFVPRGPGMENLGLLKGMTLERLGERKELLRTFDSLRRDVDARGEMAGMDAFTGRALEMITSSQARDAFDLNRESDRVRARYGLMADLPANVTYLVLKQFLLARRLVEAGVSVVALQAFGEWDTHADNFKTLRRLVPVVDRGISALVGDLCDRGLDRDVVVVMWGEFGRGPKIYSLNGNPPGRDHHGPANFVLFAGGGLKMGQVVGATDVRGERPKGTPYTPQNVLATLYHVLGIDPAATLPDHSGRPIYLLDEREPIAELV